MDLHRTGLKSSTGEVVSPPCMVPVKTYPVIVVDDKVTIEV